MSERNFRAPCPHCKKIIEIRSRFELSAVIDDEIVKVPKETDQLPDKLTPEQRQFIDLAISNGMLDAFKTAVINGSMAEHPPNNMEEFFLLVLRTSKPRIIPRIALDLLMESFGGKGFIEFFSGNGIGIVTVDRRIRAFMPVQLAIGESVKNDSRTIKYRMDTDESQLRNWIKTRMGYVPAGSTIYLDELRRKSIGEFANPSSPIRKGIHS